ncbi:MAG: flagellar export chaperone FlgN [Desulfovibrio sp.]|nr:flagellar export chaperone FlgN [Desulfovibrio sp.]
MYQIIQESLFRQDKALHLLRDLLEEEYEILLGRDTGAVASLEFSIQELIRQIAVEKSLVIRSLSGKRVLEYAETLPEDQASVLRQLFQSVDAGEQGVSRQASRNAQLSLALLDQSTHNLKALTSQVTPLTGVYSRNGDIRRSAHPQAALISGRL